MKTINVTGPEGNVFCILGYAKDIQRQLKGAGGSNSAIDDVLKNYATMTYDEILDRLQSTGFLKFTGRGRKLILKTSRKKAQKVATTN